MSDRRSPEPLLIPAKDAAKLLGISRKTLWNHTAPRGDRIPAVTVGKTVRYCPEALKRWIGERMNGKS